MSFLSKATQRNQDDPLLVSVPWLLHSLGWDRESIPGCWWPLSVFICVIQSAAFPYIHLIVKYRNNRSFVLQSRAGRVRMLTIAGGVLRHTHSTQKCIPNSPWAVKTLLTWQILVHFCISKEAGVLPLPCTLLPKWVINKNPRCLFQCVENISLPIIY